MSFKLRDESDSDRRAKPEDAAQATLMICVGDAPPENIREWSLGTTLTETTNQRYTFPHDVVSGSTVWLLAFWQNPKGKPGPNSVAVSTVIGGGVEHAGVVTRPFGESSDKRLARREGRWREVSAVGFLRAR